MRACRGIGRRFCRSLVLAGLLVLAACAGEDEEGLPGVETGPGIPYTVTFEGPISDELAPLLDQASVAKNEEDRPPPDELVLTQRARRDIDNLTRAMHSLGYYDGTVQWRDELAEPEAAAAPAPAAGAAPAAQAEADEETPPARRLIFTLDPGRRYHLGQLGIEVVGTEPAGADLPTIQELGLEAGEPVDAQRILDAEQRLVRLLRERGHPFATAEERRAELDQSEATLNVTFVVDVGPVARFGEITLTGIEGIDERFLRARLTVHENEPFTPAVLEESRRELIDTGLFATVQVVTPNQLDATGRLPVTFEATQRAQRSIAAGARYRTDEGPGVSLSWEHRNFFGAGERLSLSGLVSAERYVLSGQFRKPDFFSRRQSLLIDGAISHEDVEAYTSDSIQLGAAIERRLTNEMTGTLGVAYRLSNVEQAGERETYGLVSIPAGLDWDTTDNVLDPTRGGRMILNASPYFDTLGSGAAFVKARGTYSHYFSLTRSRRVVLALRGSIGTITADSIDDVPPDERFYAGGGGSVRGIGFQLASPLDADDDPIGGLSIVELNTELRWRFTDTIGMVAFLDAGSAFADPTPLSGGDLRLGAGIGARYYTPIGPVRLDVAVPLDRREGIDDDYQIYVSIGQAF
ncbi:autotransporter assembly complex protein TamA [Geminicoccus harenae]|uniref:autotransporter assembly complex protein TamA n=1 Tax=Geminicoccus harenae TaxID=2498453 RepID=UPI00168AEF6A|nr:autotransporter assembly complex family protein [Geminicoccus harenae]